VTPEDERRRDGTWRFEFGDGEQRGAVRLDVEDRAARYAASYAAGDLLVVIRAPDIRLPRSGLEFRADGIWAALICETPLEHWSVGLECYGLLVDHLDDEVGDRIPFGLDLEWEGVAPPDGDEQACEVHGEVLLGEDRIEIASPGRRSHGPLATGAG
jgi:hypothetical protein